MPLSSFMCPIVLLSLGQPLLCSVRIEVAGVFLVRYSILKPRARVERISVPLQHHLTLRFTRSRLLEH